MLYRNLLTGKRKRNLRMSLFTLIAFAFLCAALYYICPLRLRWILLLLVSYGHYA